MDSGASDVTFAEAPVHPDFPERGVREIPLGSSRDKIILGIPARDFNKLEDGEVFRMKDLANFTLRKADSPKIEFHSLDVDEVRKIDGRIIHWIPKDGSVPVELVEVDGSIEKGRAEPSVASLPVGTFLQFERVGFARIYDRTDITKVAFSHK